MRFLRIACLAGLCFAMTSESGLASDQEKTPRGMRGEVQPDKALLYVIAPKRGFGGGGSVKLDLFADEDFILQVKGNSYAYGYVDPGRRLIWGACGLHELEFVPGEVYYLYCSGGASLLTDEEGEVFVSEAKHFVPFNPAIESKKKTKAAKHFPKARTTLDEWAEVHHAEVEQAPARSRPASAHELLQVPAHTSVTLELMQTISSSLSSLGETVWFRVTDGVDVEGKTWLPTGTPVQGKILWIHHSGRFGISGGFEIRIPKLETPGGVEVPLIGQWLSSGRPRAGASSWASALGGVIGGGLVKGREAFEPAGIRIPVWTRGAVWVDPVEDTLVEKPTELVVEKVLVLAARALTPMTHNPERRPAPSPIEVLVEAGQDVTSMRLVRVGNWNVPDPPEAIRLARSEHDSAQDSTSPTVATFNGWDLLRHLRPGSEAIVRFEGQLGDGTLFAAEATLDWAPAG